MIQIRLWAYKIAPILGEVTSSQFKAIAICENTAQLLAKMYKGKTDCSSCGCVQYSDTVIVESLSQEDETLILNTYPFVTIRKPITFN
jgi:hypothetical protein